MFKVYMARPLTQCASILDAQVKLTKVHYAIAPCNLGLGDMLLTSLLRFQQADGRAKMTMATDEQHRGALAAPGALFLGTDSVLTLGGGGEEPAPSGVQ